MKKLAVLLLVGVMTLTVITGCGKGNDAGSVETETTEAAQSGTEIQEEASQEAPEQSQEAVVEDSQTESDVAAIFQSIMDKDAELAGMPLDIYGGDVTNFVQGKVGAINLSVAEGTADLSSRYFIPAELQEKVTSAAGCFNTFNANTFTGVMVELADASEAESLSASIADGIKNTQWLCGFPQYMEIGLVDTDKLLVMIGESGIVEGIGTAAKEVTAYETLVGESLE